MLLDNIQVISPDRHDLIQELRTLILELTTDISEEIKYSGILFATNYNQQTPDNQKLDNQITSHGSKGHGQT